MQERAEHFLTVSQAVSAAAQIKQCFDNSVKALSERRLEKQEFKGNDQQEHWKQNSDNLKENESNSKGSAKGEGTHKSNNKNKTGP